MTGGCYRVIALSGSFVVCGILGNSLSFVLTVLCVMCLRFFSGLREDTDLIVHTREIVMFRGSWIINQTNMELRFVMYINENL